MKTMILTYPTSATALRHLPSQWSAAERVVSSVELTDSATSARDLAHVTGALSELGIRPKPGMLVHVLAGERRACHSSRLVTVHVHGAELPAGSLCQATDGIVVCSPELSFLQAARVLPLEQLVLYGMELCGSYALNDSQRGFVDREPLTSRAKIGAYLAKMRGVHGVAKARQALRYVSDGSRSPMESVIEVICVLPRRRGGFGLERPSMNHRISLAGSGVTGLDRSSLEMDLYWEAYRMCLEYKGRAYHEGDEMENYDSMRETALKSMGIHVVTVRRMQVVRPGALADIEREIAVARGRRPPRQDAELIMRRASLCNSLLSFGKSYR